MSTDIKLTSSNMENLRLLSHTCDVNAILASIGLRWKMQVLYCISQDVHQFSRLREIFPTLSDQVLGKRINELQLEGLITKNTIPDTVPRQIRYEVTGKGKELLAIVLDLHHWGKRWNQL